MSREIKFRAWNPTLKEMIPLRIKKYLGSFGIIDQTLYSCESIWMQFTGLTDKNGVEIYENDVVYLAGYGNYLVEFPFIELYEAQFENNIGAILGNIHEHPHLLEKNNESIYQYKQ